MRFEDFRAGQVLTAGPRTITAREIVEFASRYDPQPFHADPARAQASRWRGLIASGWHTCSIAMELMVGAVLHDSCSIGSPGLDELRWPNPVRPGDELRLQVEVLEARPSRSGTTGVVRWRWQLTRQDGDLVLSLVCTNLFEIHSGSCRPRGAL